MKHREIEANGISLHFVEEGDGPQSSFVTAFRRSGRVGRRRALAAVGSTRCRKRGAARISTEPLNSSDRARK
jgi:hypothetical protein